MLSQIQRGREVWYDSMRRTIDYYSKRDLTLEGALEYLHNDEDSQILTSPSMYIGAMIETLNHPVMFVRAMGYSIEGFIKTF
ncbi:MAG: hypothetical protein IIA87_02200 [Nanoarchaeota archaeon]|nr:hypothetical protein [Nanoarchaeota archaeon]